MEQFVVEGRARIKGVVTPSGNKNGAFPAIAAALLTDQPVRLENVPDIADVRTMLDLVAGLGVRVQRHDRHAVTLHAVRLSAAGPDADLLLRLRGGHDPKIAGLQAQPVKRVHHVYQLPAAQVRVQPAARKTDARQDSVENMQRIPVVQICDGGARKAQIKSRYLFTGLLDLAARLRGSRFGWDRREDRWT